MWYLIFAIILLGVSAWSWSKLPKILEEWTKKD